MAILGTRGDERDEGRRLRRRALLVAGGGFALVVALPALLGGAGLASSRGDMLRRAEPVLEGALTLSGPADQIAVRRDERGVPHVSAHGAHDAWFGLGFVHAQDRPGQMLWLRRLARGRAAEVLGERALPADRLVRTLGIGREADAEAASLPSAQAERLAAYAAGIRAHLSTLDPVVLRALVDAPEDADAEPPWQPGDSLAIARLLSWAMGPSLEAALVFEELVEQLGAVGARPLLPTGRGVRGIELAFQPPGGSPPRPLRRPRNVVADSDLARAGALLSGVRFGAAAWVVPGAQSASGSPLLATEFQLPPSVPVLAYEAHLRCKAFDVVGATIPGVPVYWAGRNGQIAWAVTPARVKSFQLYRETIRRVGDQREAQHGRQWKRLETREEEIRVRRFGGDVERESIAIARTVHGPLLNDLLPRRIDPISVDWVGAGRGDGLKAMMDLVLANDAAALTDALSGHRDPIVNVAFADRAGAAGWQVAGWLPKRMLGTAGLPAPGAQRAFDLDEALKFSALPRFDTVADDPDWIIAADNALVTEAKRNRIEWSWRHGRRARRIERGLSGLRNRGPIELRGLAELQNRLTAQVSPRVIPAIDSLLRGGPPTSREANEVLGALRNWDGRLAPDRRGAAAYRVLARELLQRLLETRLPASTVDRYLALRGLEPEAFVEAALLDAATNGRAGGWSDPASLASLLPESLHQTWVELAARRGPNRARWNWGGLHALVFRSFVGFDADSAQVLWGYGGDAPLPGSGGGVGAAAYDTSRPFAARSASLYRMAVDLAADDRILTTLAPGQSEHPGQAHFRDGLYPWLNGQPRLVARSAFLVEEQTSELLRLEPAS